MKATVGFRRLYAKPLKAILGCLPGGTIRRYSLIYSRSFKSSIKSDFSTRPMSRSKSRGKKGKAYDC